MHNVSKLKSIVYNRLQLVKLPKQGKRRRGGFIDKADNLCINTKPHNFNKNTSSSANGDAMRNSVQMNCFIFH